jgi:hypothetical protein
LRFLPPLVRSRRMLTDPSRRHSRKNC